MKTAKSILFRVSIAGNGVVNFDSSQQKYLWNTYKGDTQEHEKCFADNVAFAKKRWYKNESGGVDTKLIISSGCLKHEVFSENIPFQSPNILHNKTLLLNLIASPASILRGYLFAAKDVLTIKRSSAITITDAEQTNNAISTLETFSKSGRKSDDNNKSDTTYFKKEVVGNITYLAVGVIDLMQLQYISADETFDRLALNPDTFNEYKKILSTRMKVDGELGYYQIKNSFVEIPELGLKLSNDNILELTKMFFKRLASLNIRKSGAYANVIGIDYKIIYDPLVDLLEDGNGWTKLTLEGIDALNFETENFYNLVDYNEAKKFRETMENEMKAVKAKTKLEKEEKDAEKASAKAKRLQASNSEGE